MREMIELELRTKCSLKFVERQRLDSGDVDGCLAAVLKRRQRVDLWCAVLFVGILAIPGLLLVLSRVLGWNEPGSNGIPVGMFAWIALLHVPTMLERRRSTNRLETLSLISTAIGPQPANQ